MREDYVALSLNAPPVCSAFQMFLHPTVRAAAAGAHDTGLGLLDAFFASLSMIVVSEVWLPAYRRPPPPAVRVFASAARIYAPSKP